MKSLTIALALTCLFPASHLAAGANDGEGWTIFEVHGGTASFEAATNLPAVGIHGKSTALEARTRLRQTGETIALEGMEATVPVKTLTTGMSLRDEHMRKYVFMTSDGQSPDLRFTAEKTSCATEGSREAKCQLGGQLAIRGQSRPFVVTLKVARDGATWRASGDGTVKLSDYGIPQPSQLGIKTLDEVKLHLAFTVKPGVAESVARAGGDR